MNTISLRDSAGRDLFQSVIKEQQCLMTMKFRRLDGQAALNARLVLVCATYYWLQPCWLKPDEVAQSFVAMSQLGAG